MTLQELGQELRRLREEQGLSIDDSANKLKISGRTLRAIEAGTLDGMPHAVYAKGFIRSYGLSLRMDPTELNERLDDVFPPVAHDEKPEPPLYQIEPSSNAMRRAAAVASLLLLVAAVLGAGWYLTAERGTFQWVKQLFSAGNGAEAGNNATREPGRNASAVPGLSGGAPSAPRAPAGAVPNPRVPEAGPVAETPRSAPQRNATEAASTAEPTTPAVNEVQITARATCWVGYRADGAQEVGYLVRSGETYSFTWKENATVRLGNPSGVAVKVNGRDFSSFSYLPSKVAEFSLP